MSKFLTDLSKNYVLAPFLDRWFKSDFTGHESIPLSINPYKAPDSAFHPSTDAVGCVRTLYAKWNPEIEFQGRSFNPKTGINGHMWHALIQHIVCDELGFCAPDAVERRYGLAKYEGSELMPWNIAEEPSPGAKGYPLQWWTTGSLDLVDVFIPGYENPFLIDIKTMDKTSFSNPTPPDFLWNKYVAQCQLYMSWAGYDKCIILGVEAASPFKFKEIVINYDPAVPEYIYNKWTTVADHLRAGVPPPHSCDDPDNCVSNSLYGNTQKASS